MSSLRTFYSLSRIRKHDPVILRHEITLMGKLKWTSRRVSWSLFEICPDEIPSIVSPPMICLIHLTIHMMGS